ncbi:ribosomal protein S18-alanine N-acetyltransferase [Extensimonas vulgaris]|uniref:[Ribosomal protein bS18]-alanine N-acetyltransferase n=1 Tax=Extensimonas vulgaris TaxID=1031594 RepID=A0A369ALM4_9BURK|nr:ribosomal protein S18-alanine N-acetyltransferase [Extensimonas vulgaris]RCX10071.1 [SSU ribosomal protein S18P]-alanine acetyltransferase [Extensimonas vulgaris]TWI36532.1 ribosomal-protein-alanine N-acetyltransferase [Extensimonas vulgaris]TXD17225.1 ribosomal-protein-alanine N-acetyltransferase [Extensimonas vulgaris]
MNARLQDPAAPQAPHALPPEVRLAPLSLERLDAVLGIEKVAYSHPWSRGNFIDTLAAGYQAQVLLGGDEVIGYYVAMLGVDEAHLLNLTVAPAFQRQGWARVLLDALGLWARGRGAQWLWLEVRVSNLRAQKIYAAHGFQRVGVRKRYYPAAAGTREDAIVMSLRL